MQSQAFDPLLAWIKSIHLPYSQVGHRSIPPHFKGLLWLANNVETLLRAEIGDHVPARRKKALGQPLSKSLVFET